MPRGLRHAFGLRTAIATALADNETGRHVEDCILTGGLDTQFISWIHHDGIGARCCQAAWNRRALRPQLPTKPVEVHRRPG